MRYHNDVYRRSLANPEGFWGEAGEAINWSRKWDNVLDQSNGPFTRWFADAELNTCFNALDGHFGRGRAEQTALIYDSPVTATIQKFTYRELLERTARFAGGRMQ